MAVTNKLTLWKLAAAHLGMSPQSNVINPDSPSTALERTFSEIYDVIRTELLTAISPEFARRTAVLREAPTLDYGNVRREWTKRWRYVYAPPRGMLRFLRFESDIPDENHPTNYQQIPLPIAYGVQTADNLASFVLSSSVSTLLPAFLYREWMIASFFDDSGVRHSIVDAPTSGSPFGFDWKDKTTLVSLPETFGAGYKDGGLWGVDFQPGVIAGVYDLAAAPSSITFELAYGDPYSLTPGSTKYTQHIATNEQSASAVYIMDVTEVALWEVEFQDAVAYEMAHRASITHAKSPRIIQTLERQALKAMSNAVSALAADDGAYEGGGLARATRARY